MAMVLHLVCDGLFAIGIFLLYFFGAIGGGIGLLVRPLLILGMGLPPQTAVGTARIAGLGTHVFGLTQFHKYGKIDWKLAGVLAIPSFLGGIMGARLVTTLDPEVLKRLIGVLILILGGVLLARKDTGTMAAVETPSPLRRLVGLMVFGLSSVIASITGGGGILASSTLILMFRKTYITAAAIRRVAGYGGTCSASVLFLASGLVSWKYATVILLAGGLGSFFGVRYGIARGERWGRMVVLVVVFLVGVRMLWY